MSTEENRALVNRYYTQVLNDRDVGLLDTLLAPGFTSHLGDLQVGAEGYRQAVMRTHAAFADLRVEVLDQVAEGDRVATRWKAMATLAGRPIQMTAMHFHRIEAGRLAEHWEELDTARLPGGGRSG